MNLGVTLARGGSKGLPGKNIRPCAGKPLIAWTIEAAKRAKKIDRYIVCTDDLAIRAAAENCGAEVLMRPPLLGADDINRWDVLRWVTSKLCRHYHAVVLLQPTSPIRSQGLIDDCVTLFEELDYTSLATGYAFRDDEYLKNRGRNRQYMEAKFIDDGNVYVWNHRCLSQNELYGERPGMKVISRWENVDINDEFDFWLAEQVLSEDPFCQAK